MKSKKEMIQNKKENLGEAEKKALKLMEKELAKHNCFSKGVFDLIGKIIDQLSEISFDHQSLKVATSLLMRISNDLHCVALLANRGYSVQAASLTTSIYEESFTVIYIGNDENLAQNWIDHNKPTKPFKSVKAITKEGLLKLDLPNAEQQTSIKYRVYRQLCMAKHSNPLFQKQHSLSISGNVFSLRNGPDTSETSIRVAWFALEHASALAWLATASFVANHVPESKRESIEQELKKLSNKRKKLASLAKVRWGTQDPFPGRW